jgi:hypothetical protein
MGHVLDMPYQRFANVPLQMRRLPKDYPTHPLRLPKLTFKSALPGQRSLGRGDSHDVKLVWILV